MKQYFISLWIVAFMSIYLFGQDERQNISVEIAHIKNNMGKVGISLFDSNEGFPMKVGKAVKTTYAAIHEGLANFQFVSIPAGEYAILVFHDEDNNGDLNTNFIGIPREGVGVSNNPKSRMGPPRYDDCKFHTDTLRNLHIKMKYIGHGQ